MTHLHRVCLVGFGAFERTTFDLFFRMSEQRAQRARTPGNLNPPRERGYLQVAPAHHPELVLINGDLPEAARHAWRWPGRCISVGEQTFVGAIAHLHRPVHMNSLLDTLDELMQGGRQAWAQAPQQAPGPVWQAASAARLLVVDDNTNTLRSMARLLRKLGLTATYAHTGEEGLYRVSQGAFELVLLDSRMPGISGWMTCRLIKTRPFAEGAKAPRVIMMARPEGPLDPLRAALCRCDGRVNKPLRKKDLVALLQPLAAEHSGSSAAPAWRPRPTRRTGVNELFSPQAPQGLPFAT